MAGVKRVHCRACLWLLLVIGGCGSANISEDSAEGAVTVTAWTEATEAFVEYPYLVARADPAPWLIHLTRRSDHSPISDGSVAVQVGSVTIPAVEAASQGIFAPEVSLPTAGTFPAAILLDSPDHQERIELGPVVVYAAYSDIIPPSFAASGVNMTKEAQWSAPFRVQRAAEGTIRRSLPAPGVIEAASSRMADVVAPVTGILVASANLNTPAEGARVGHHEVLATIAPLSSESSFAAVNARAEQTKQELDRLTRLFDVGAVPQNRLLDAQRDYDVAHSALQELGGVAGENNRYVVRAPIAGFVEDRTAIAGEAVAVGDPLFRIVDPSVVWIRLLLHVRDAAYAHNIEGVTFTVEGSERVYASEDLVAVGSEIAIDNRTLPLILAVPNEDRSLTIGLFAEGHVIISGEEAGVVLPNDAIQKEDGVAVAYVQVEGELFARRTVVLGANNGTHTLIEAGVASGEYVVTHGAYNVYLASLNIGGGAAHHH